MRILLLPLICFCLLISACAATQVSSTQPPADYVEIDNPAITMSNNAPEKIWVPRSSVENSPGNAGDLLKQLPGR